MQLDVNPEPADCAGTGTKIGYFLFGALVGGGTALMVSDAQKAEAKTRAKARAANAADRAAARLRR